MLKKIKLSNFRNYINTEVVFSPGINIIYGDNAQGKTNLLESIYFLAITKSHRSFIDKTIINSSFNETVVTGETNDKTKYKVYINRKEKKMYINDFQIRKIEDYISNLNVVIFCPDDIEILKGGPQERRKMINIAIGQNDKKYLFLLSEYNNLLKQRNAYLKKQDNIDEIYFQVITEKLIKIANTIFVYRKNYINKINKTINNIYEKISDQKGYKIKYFTTSNQEDYMVNLSQEFIKMKKQELRLGSTLCGPHRDDFIFELNEMNIKDYGSQGQQRMAILSFKMAELQILLNEKEVKPILLLDDVFSELDGHKKNNIINYIDEKVQTFITTTHIENILKETINKATIYKIEKGEVIKDDRVK